VRRFALIMVLGLFFIVPQVARAEQCLVAPIFSESFLSAPRPLEQRPCNPALVVPVPDGKVVGAGIIYLYAHDEARYSSLNNVLHAIQQLEGKYIYPGEIFSFNRAANLLEDSIPYDLGPDVSDNLVKAGGVCMVSTMIATAAHDAGLPFINARGKAIPAPIPHSRFYRYYHQVNLINGHPVPIVEASVAITRDDLDRPWQTVQDMEFINTSGHILVLHFEPSFSVDNLDLSRPFGLIQQDEYLKVELRAIPTGLDAWFSRFNALAN
jgi:hypothetical protein